MSNLVLIRTLRHSTDPDVRKPAVHLCWRSTDFRSLINKVFCGSVLALDYEFNSPCPRLLTQGPWSNFEIGGGGAPLVIQYWGGGGTEHFSY